MTVGFFSASTWQLQQAPLSLVPECGKCGLYKQCKTPYMKPTGAGRRKVLIVAEAPGETEDERGYQLCGNSGLKLVEVLHRIGVNMRKDCWLTNAMICRPTKWEGGRIVNRNPTAQEVAYCRPNLTKTIEQLQPEIIIPLGKPAVQSIMPLIWKDGEVDDIGTWVRWQIPSVKLNSWVCPTYHPSYLLHEKNAAAELWVTKHLRAAFSLSGRPWPTPPSWEDQIDVEMNVAAGAAKIRKLMATGKPLAFDYETTCLKPDGPHAEILCVSVSDGITSVAVPWHGPVLDAIRDLAVSDIPKVVANLRMEDRWTRKFLKVPVRNWMGGRDIVVGAHHKDCRHGICSLKFQAFVLLGTPDYDSHLAAYKESKDSNSPNRLKEVEPRVLLKYCALDSLFEVLVAERQMEA
jgi:uracil-DNA glycosylase family 4